MASRASLFGRCRAEARAVSLSTPGPWSRRCFLPRRPPSGRRPPFPSAPPRHRRPAPPAAATAASCARPPPPPPQPHPLRRSSSGGSGTTPEVTARTCQIAPAGNRSLRGPGRLRSSVDAGEGGNTPLARTLSLMRLGVGRWQSLEIPPGNAVSRSLVLHPRLRVQLSNYVPLSINSSYWASRDRQPDRRQHEASGRQQ